MATQQTWPPPSGLARRGFVVPRGILGHIGGRLMASGNGPAQSEVAGLIAIGPDQRVLEIGYGPGALLQLLAEHSTAAAIVGVDPSPVMRAQALRRCRTAVAVGRVTPGLGTAEQTGQPDQSFDHVVSVNNFPFWDDLTAGLGELRRVLRPSGTITIAFHSRYSPVRHERRMGLSEQSTRQTQASMAATFDKIQQHHLEHVVAFTGVRDRWAIETPLRS